MQSENVKAFKNELRNYNFYLTRIKKINSLIEYCYSLLPQSVHAIDYSQPVIHGAPNKDNEYRIRDDISKHEANVKSTQVKINEVDEILALMETSLKRAVIDVYVEGKRIEDIAILHHLSIGGLQYRIDKEIERCLNVKNY